MASTASPPMIGAEVAERRMPRWRRSTSRTRPTRANGALRTIGASRGRAWCPPLMARTEIAPPLGEAEQVAQDPRARSSRCTHSPRGRSAGRSPRAAAFRTARWPRRSAGGSASPTRGCGRESLGLEWERVDLSSARIRLDRTKSGEPRGVPVNGAVYEALIALEPDASGGRGACSRQATIGAAVRFAPPSCRPVGGSPRPGGAGVRADGTWIGTKWYNRARCQAGMTPNPARFLDPAA
jgi:hypothetical protein